MADCCFGSGYAPNHLIKHAVTSTAAWGVVGADGVIYTTLALLTAGGTVPYPGSTASNTGLDPGGFLLSLAVRTENASGADGGAFYIAFNKTSAPADDDADFISGSGQTRVFAPARPWNIWIKKMTAGDEVILSGGY